MSKLIQEIEQEQLKKDIPEFGAGDTVVVQVRVKEGNRERLQAYEGVVIAKRNRGLNSSFTVSQSVPRGGGGTGVPDTQPPDCKHHTETPGRCTPSQALLFASAQWKIGQDQGEDLER